MATKTCALCGKQKDTNWAGAGFCTKCGFICSNCAKGHRDQCPKCGKYKLKK